MSFLWTVRSDDFLVGYYAGLALLSTSPHLNKATAEIVELDIFAACEEMERRGIIVTFSTAQVRERYARFKLQEKIAGALYEHESNFGAKWADCDCVNTRDDYLESADAVLAVLPQGAEPDGDREWQIATAPDGRWLPAEEWNGSTSIWGSWALPVRVARGSRCSKWPTIYESLPMKPRQAGERPGFRTGRGLSPIFSASQGNRHERPPPVHDWLGSWHLDGYRR